MAQKGYMLKKQQGKGIAVKATTVRSEVKAIDKANKLEYRKARLFERKINKSYRNEFGFPILRILFVMLLISALVCFLRYGNVDNAFTFNSLLKFLQGVPTVDFAWLDIQEVVLELPGWLSWLDNIINFFASIVEFFGFILAGLWQALTFILYFIKFMLA